MLRKTMQKNKGLVVVVDDDEDIRLALSMLLTNEGYQVMEAGSTCRALGEHNRPC